MDRKPFVAYALVAVLALLVLFELFVGRAGRVASVSASATKRETSAMRGEAKLMKRPVEGSVESLPPGLPLPDATPAPLQGFVDLHTHPMSNLAFGGKLFYGGVDATPEGGSLLPADPDCFKRVRALDEQQALGHDESTHGPPIPIQQGNLGNPCGDVLRAAVISTVEQNDIRQANPHYCISAGSGFGSSVVCKFGTSGYPGFPDWPKWNDILHQKMWVEWIRRAYQGGLRVMVALAHNNKSLGDITAGPGDYPTDDKSSADLQIDEIKSFVGRHRDFMEIAYYSADVYRIVSQNKLAVIIGVELDHIGNFQTTPNPVAPKDADVKAEIDRLYEAGVRYIFPIHLLDNAFGGASAYVSLFDVSNVRETGHSWALVCANPADWKDTDISKSALNYVGSNAIKDQANGGFTYDDSLLSSEVILVQLLKTRFAIATIPTPKCPAGTGQKNSLPLTQSGEIAIREMMRLGMLIDIDHMSQAAADQALALACYGDRKKVPLFPPEAAPCTFGYPLNSGHNAVRGTVPPFIFPNQNDPSHPSVISNAFERALRADQYAVIGKLHGMAGVGSAGIDAQQWLTMYNQVITAMGGDPSFKSYAPGTIVAGFGTDTDGLQMAMPPRPGCSPTTRCVTYTTGRNDPLWAIPQSKDGSKTWDYNSDGVAHYGMPRDFLADVRTLTGSNGANMVDNNFMYGADYFFQTWKIAEACGTAISQGASTCFPKPVIANISPARGPFTGGTRVTITGNGFAVPTYGSPADTKFLIGSTPLVTLGPPCSSTTTCIIDMLPGKPGKVNIMACAGECSPPAPFTYTENPEVTEFRLPQEVGQFTGINGAVYLNGNAPPTGAKVTFWSSNPDIVPAPDPVIIPGNFALAGVAMTLLPTPKKTTVTLMATYQSSSVSAKVDADVWLPLGLAMDKNDLVTSERTNAALSINAFAPSGGAAISLTCSDNSAVAASGQTAFTMIIDRSPILLLCTSASQAPVPVSVRIPVGTYSTTFPISHNYRGPFKAVTITAKYNDASASLSLTVSCAPPKVCPARQHWNRDDCRCEAGSLQ